MSIPTEGESQSQAWIKEQMADHISALEAEIDKQDELIKLLVKALFLTYGEKK
jgi:hypothetical protein